MEAHNINKESWHYKMMARYDMISDHDQPDDICGYRRRFLKTLAMMLTVSAFAFVIGFVIVDLITWAIASYGVGWYFKLLSIPTKVLLLMVGVVGGVIVAIFGIAYAVTAAQDAVRNVEAPTIRTMWQTAKEKYCVPVEFK